MSQQNIDSFFPAPERGNSHPVSFADVPYMSRRIVEQLHKLEPGFIAIAADRGGRLVVHGILGAWHYQYPGERFPSSGHSIYHSRITAKHAAATNAAVVGTIHDTLRRAGLQPNWQATERYRGKAPPRLVFIDDWVWDGESVCVFLAAVQRWNIPPESVTIVTLCGDDFGSLDHIRGDPGRFVYDSAWNDSDAFTGVRYTSASDNGDGVTPEAAFGYRASDARNAITRQLERYYMRYRAAMAAGQIATADVTPHE